MSSKRIPGGKSIAAYMPAPIALPPLPDDGPAEWHWQDIRSAAKVVVSRTSMTEALVRESSLFDAALSGVALAVAENPQVEWVDACAAGARALWDEASRTLHSYGGSPSRPMPRFHAYWSEWTRPFTTSAACESSMTLTAVLDALPDRHRQTLGLFAGTDSMDEAAELAGVGRHTFKCRLLAARRAALQLWFDHEMPPDLKRLPIHRRGRDRHCPQGHAISGGNVYRETRRGGRVVERCATCRAEQRRRYREVPA